MHFLPHHISFMTFISLTLTLITAVENILLFFHQIREITLFLILFLFWFSELGKLWHKATLIKQSMRNKLTHNSFIADVLFPLVYCTCVRVKSNPTTYLLSSVLCQSSINIQKNSKRISAFSAMNVKCFGIWVLQD